MKIFRKFFYNFVYKMGKILGNHKMVRKFVTILTI